MIKLLRRVFGRVAKRALKKEWDRGARYAARAIWTAPGDIRHAVIKDLRATALLSLNTDSSKRRAFNNGVLDMCETAARSMGYEKRRKSDH